MDKTILDDKLTVLSSDYTPTYEQLYIHPEEGEDFRINEAFLQIDTDMRFIDNFLITKSTELNDLMLSVAERLDNIDLDIKSEQERLQDIKMLCNKFTDFDNVIPINENTKLTGNYTLDNGSFYCDINKKSKAKIQVLSVTGNGIEGNKYVYKDFAYVQDSVDTSNRSYITDNSLTSCYEYERITASSTEEYLLGDFNTDDANAICTFELYSEDPMNLLTITSDNDSLSVIGLQYSYDGVNYIPIAIPTIKINDKLACYDNYDYICGDNKIILPECNFAKITFQSSGTTDDVLAHDRIMFWHEVELTDEEKAELDAEDGIIGGYIGAEYEEAAPYNNVQDATIVVKSAKRHVIKINDITAHYNMYVPASHFKTGELITDGKFYSAALFLNAYIPEELKSDSVQIIFTINGIDYKVTPVNSMYSGDKVFRYSQGKSKLEYTQLLDEPIKSLYLTVKINGNADFTPIIGNVKVLLGGEI